MTLWNDTAAFIYGRGFWYSTVDHHIEDLSDEQLLWVPDPNMLPILWHAGHIAHRERLHIGRFLQGLVMPVHPPGYDIFGTEWVPAESIAGRLDELGQTPADVLGWIGAVRQQSLTYISSLAPDDWHRVPETSELGQTVAEWIWITSCHTALHLGRIQMLRNMALGLKDNPC